MCFGCFDDILVYSRTYEDHCHHLKLVFQLLQHDKWQVKISKCSFAKRQLAYLGHIISGEGVSIDPKKNSVDIVVRVGSLSDWLHHHQLMTDAIKLHLPHAKHRMKRRADSSKSLIGCF